jgi:hypothetical protein
VKKRNKISELARLRRELAFADVCAGECEASHIGAKASALSHDAVGPTSWREDGTNEDAADGILVVQIRHLRTISREISETAARQAFIAPHACNESIRRSNDRIDTAWRS